MMLVLCNEKNGRPMVVDITRPSAGANATKIGVSGVKVTLEENELALQILMPSEVAARLVIALTPLVNDHVNWLLSKENPAQ